MAITRIKYSKTPWFMFRNNTHDCGMFGVCRGIWDSDGTDVAYFPATDGDNGNANAALGSAAPDLLFACFAAQDFLAENGSEEAKALSIKIERAIRRATNPMREEGGI